MKAQLVKDIGVVCCLMLGLPSTWAAATLRLSDDGGATWTVIVDNGSEDLRSAAGCISFDGFVGITFLNTTIGLTKPTFGNAGSPSMEILVNNVAYLGGGTVIAQFSDTDFTPSEGIQAYNVSAGGSTSGNITLKSWRDNGDVLFGSTENYPLDFGVSPSPTAIALTSQGPFSGSAYTGIASGSASGNTPYSLTLQVAITDSLGGLSVIDALLQGPSCDCAPSIVCPEPATVNCGGDTSTNGLPMPVIFADPSCKPVVTTNDVIMPGNCPGNYVINRTWTVTPQCGDAKTCTQTITVQDTIKPVVTSVPTGGDLGCSPANLPTDASVKSLVSATDCSGVTIEVSHVDGGTLCASNRTFTITATDSCGNTSDPRTVVYTFGCPSSCVPATFAFSGSSAQSGAVNSRTFTTSNGVIVKVSGFSRAKDTGAWSPAYVGLYSGGLGVTDSSEGDGSNNAHTTDNIGRDNFLLFEFSQPVVVDRAYLGYVTSDSDMSVWIGSFADPFNNHLTLSDGVLGSFGFTEENLGGSSTRWADLNSGKVVGNALIIAARLNDSGDQFKVNKLDICNLGTAQTVPSPWTTKDIGAVAATGAASSSNGKFTVIGSGAYIWGTADEFRYLYQSASDNCSLVARVTGVQDTDAWAKAGVMIRESLSTGARQASMFIFPTNGVQFQSRTSTGVSSTDVITKGPLAPYWLKIERVGSTFNGYTSLNGSAWTLMGSRAFSMSSSVCIGFAVTSHNDGTLCAATFDNVTATP